MHTNTHFDTCRLHSCMHACMHTCTCMHACTHMHTCMHARTHARTHTHIQWRMYLCTHTSNWDWQIHHCYEVIKVHVVKNLLFLYQKSYSISFQLWLRLQWTNMQGASGSAPDNTDRKVWESHLAEWFPLASHPGGITGLHLWCALQRQSLGLQQRWFASVDYHRIQYHWSEVIIMTNSIFHTLR